MKNIELPVRYGREIPAPGDESDEANLRYGELRWSLPVHETALVLVDCWDDFTLGSFVERAGEVCRTKIRPVLETCRELDPIRKAFRADGFRFSATGGPAYGWQASGFRLPTLPMSRY